MTISVLLFGPQAALSGKRELDVTVEGASPSPAEVLAAIEQAEPKLAASLRTSRLAINHEFAGDDQLVSDGDEVALIGMVSGG